MTIFRTEHKRNYTTVNNFICKDSRLSWKAKGIWLYAFSRPDDWEFHESDIVKQSCDGRDSVRAGLKELQECGYLIKDKQDRTKGKFSAAEWVFYETPQELKKCLPQTEIPSSVFPSSENPLLPSIDSLPIPEIHGNAAMPSNSDSQDKIPKKEKALNPDQQEKFDLMKQANLNAEDHSLRFLSRTYSKEKIIDALHHLQREIDKGTKFKKDKIAFFRYILSGKVSMITPQASTNKQWAEAAKHGMPWPSLVIHEKYVECSKCLKEIPLDLPKKEFGEAMDNLWNLSQKY